MMMQQQQAAVYAVDVFTDGTVHHASELGSLEELQGLEAEIQERQGYPGSVTLQAKDPLLGCTPLHAAAERGHMNIVQYLIKQQVDLDAADGQDVRPLHLAAITNRLDVVKLLIDKGANPTKQDQEGNVPVHWAATKGHVEMIEMLLHKGAAVDAPNREGWTALHCAVCCGHVAACQLLLRRGAGLQAVTRDGRTPLHLAASNNHLGVIELLLDLGAGKHFRDNKGAAAIDLCISDAARSLIRERGAAQAHSKGNMPSSNRPLSSMTAAAASSAAMSATSPAAAPNISHIPDMPRYKPALNRSLDADGFPVAMEQQVGELQPAGSAELQLGTQLLLLDGPVAGDIQAQTSAAAAVEQVVAEISSRSSLIGYQAIAGQSQQQQQMSAVKSNSFHRSTSGSAARLSHRSQSGSRHSLSGAAGSLAAASVLTTPAGVLLDAQSKPRGPNQQFLQKYGLHKAGLFGK